MNENDKMPFDFRLWEALKQKCCIKPEQANTIVFLGAERFLEAIGPVIKQYRNDIQRETREAAFAEIGVELRRYGANIRKVDLMARFQELFREIEAAASTEGR